MVPWVGLGLALGGVLLAGCAGAAPPAEEAGPTGEIPDEPSDVTDELGAIRGVVVDDSAYPIANASVVLETTGLDPAEIDNTTTDEAGAFRFRLVEPGTYRVRVAHAAYFETATIVQVAAGEVAEPRVLISFRPRDVPYVELRIMNGATGCDSVGLVVTFAVLGDACPAAGPETGYSANLSDSWRYAVWELTWDAPDEFLGFLVTPNLFTCDTDPCYGVTVGPPSVRLDGAPGRTMQNETGFYNDPTGGIIPYPEGAFVTSVFAYHGGLLGRQTTQAMASTGYCPEWCYGVGTTVERRFTVYESVFHFEAPPEPAAYSALPDQ